MNNLSSHLAPDDLGFPFTGALLGQDPSDPPPRLGGAVPRLSYLTGFEGTQMFGHGTDVLDTTEHTVRYKEDLKLLVADGIDTFRCCIPWH